MVKDHSDSEKGNPLPPHRPVIESQLVVRWIVGSIPHGDPLTYFSLQPALPNWCNKDRGVCYPVCGMVHIKEPLLLAAAGFLALDLYHMSKRDVAPL